MTFRLRVDICSRCTNSELGQDRRPPTKRPLAKTDCQIRNSCRPWEGLGQLGANHERAQRPDRKPLAMTMKPESEPRKACPICAKPSVKPFAPFCSKRCADIDLGRWLQGVYSIPGLGSGGHRRQREMADERQDEKELREPSLPRFSALTRSRSPLRGALFRFSGVASPFPAEKHFISSRGSSMPRKSPSCWPRGRQIRLVAGPLAGRLWIATAYGAGCSPAARPAREHVRSSICRPRVS